jgi:hypothetical protein
VKLFEHALSVMNRALSSGAKPAALFGGAEEGNDVFVTVIGANPDRVAKLVAQQHDAE